MEQTRAEIIVSGLVQGVGFRYFVITTAEELGIKGFTKNLMNGDVEVIAEGERSKIDALVSKLKIGPMHAQVKEANIRWKEYKGEFSRFEVRY